MRWKDDLDHARTLLSQGHYTCVFCQGDTIYTSQETGIRPLVRLLSEQTPVAGFAAADKIVGKAAALLYGLLGVTKLHAAVLSEAALEVLWRQGILVTYNTLTPQIINRQGTGLCPMELAVAAIHTPEDAYLAIEETLAKLART